MNIGNYYEKVNQGNPPAFLFEPKVALIPGYTELVKSAAKFEDRKEDYETVLKSIAKEMVSNELKRGSIFTKYVSDSSVDENKIDEAGVGDLYQDIINREAAPVTLLNTSLWMLLFLPVGIAKALYHGAEYVATGKYNSLINRPEASKDLKKAFEYFYNAYA